jgi:hypothetical protein
MGPDLLEVRNITNVVTDAILLVICIVQPVAHTRKGIDGFQNRNAVITTATEIVDLTSPGELEVVEEQASDILSMQLIPDLLALISENCVPLLKKSAPYDVRKIAV